MEAPPPTLFGKLREGVFLILVYKVWTGWGLQRITNYDGMWNLVGIKTLQQHHSQIYCL